MAATVRKIRAIAFAAVLALGLGPIANPVAAQTVLRPSDDAPARIDPIAAGRADESVQPETPRIRARPERDGAADTALPRAASATTPGLEIRASGFEVLGCTAFDRGTLAALLEPAVDRSLTTLDLLALVERVRTLYRDAGYATTEVWLPDQDLHAGLVRIEVLEGRVDDIEIAGATHVRDAWYRARLRRAVRAPLDIDRLKRALERLQAESRVERVAAALVEISPARHRLVFEVDERAPWSVRLRASNHRSPSIGSLGGRIELGHASLLGFGDRLHVGGEISEGLRDLRVAWDVPLTPWDTRFGVSYRLGRAEIVEQEFERLDIEGRYESIGLSLEQPVYRGRTLEAWLGLHGEWRKATSSIFGRVDCFQADLSDCTPSAAIARVRGDLTWRGARRAVALRSMLSFGVDALGSTPERDAGDRDGEFVSGLFQVQWSELLPEIPSVPFFDGTQLLARADLQLASDPLLSIEQIAIGGARNVRGYRQNQIVRDNGVTASLELRVPIWRSGFGRPIVEVAPFVDYGSGWDRRRGRSPDETLVSAGVALRIEPVDGVRGEISWAGRLREDLVEGDRLQAEGVYFEVVWDVF